MTNAIKMSLAAAIAFSPVSVVTTKANAAGAPLICEPGCKQPTAPTPPPAHKHKYRIAGQHIATRGLPVPCASDDDTDVAIEKYNRAVATINSKPVESIQQSWTTDGVALVPTIHVSATSQLTRHGCSAVIAKDTRIDQEKTPNGESYVKTGEHILVGIGTVLVGAGSVEYGSAALAGKLANKITIQGSSASSSATGGSATANQQQTEQQTQQQQQQQQLANQNNTSINNQVSANASSAASAAAAAAAAAAANAAPNTPIGKNSGLGSAQPGW